MAEEFETDSSVRVYQDNWTPVVGEQLLCELGQRISAKSLCSGHIISTVCSLLVDHCDASQSCNTLTVPNNFLISYKAGKLLGRLSMVKHSWLAKNCENRESFSPRMFYRIRYAVS